MKINRDEIYEMIASLLDIDVALAKGIDEKEDFRAYGMTSVLAIRLVIMLEERYQITLKEEDVFLTSFDTFEKLFHLLERY